MIGDESIEKHKYIDDVIFENLEVLEKMLSENNSLINMLEEKISPFLFDLDEPMSSFPEIEPERPNKILSNIEQIIEKVNYNNGNINRIIERTRKQ